MNHDFDWSDFIEGSLTGILFQAGGIAGTMSLKTGPGGPVNALITTQIVY